MNTYYLNNTGSRWMVIDRNGKKPKHTFLTSSGKEAERTAIFYEMFGNFAVACISWKGKKVKVFLDEVLPD
jgi:hypothetical protein